jgi:hypothetical protein
MAGRVNRLAMSRKIGVRLPTTVEIFCYRVHKGFEVEPNCLMFPRGYMSWCVTLTTHQHVVLTAASQASSRHFLCVCVIRARCRRRRSSLRVSKGFVSFILVEPLLLIFLKENFVFTHPATPVKDSYVGFVRDCNI